MSAATISPANRICLGVFTGAHGVKGLAKVKSFTADPLAIAAYGPLQSEDKQREFTLTIERPLKGDLLLVSAPQIAHREDAIALKGTKLFIDRDLLPALDDPDEFYLEDLIGLRATDADGHDCGTVSAVHQFGAGDVIELKNIPGKKGSRLIPFTKEAVPDLDLVAGKITVDPVFLDDTLPTNDGEQQPTKSRPPKPKQG